MAHLFSAPILYLNRFYTGLVTQRSPLAVPIRTFGRRLIELYDAMIDGNDAELTNNLTIQRRPGYVAYNSNTLSGSPQNYFSFNTSLLGILPIVDTTTNVYNVQPGATAPTSLITKTQPDQSFFKAVGDTLYIANPLFEQKWLPNTSQVENWGIAVGTGTTGAHTAGLGTNAGSGTIWVNPNNVTSNVVFATTAPPANATSRILRASNFTPGVPTNAAITGIEVTFNADVPASSPNAPFLSVSLQGGVTGPTSTNKVVKTTSGVTAITLGGMNDLWGTSWTHFTANAMLVNFVAHAGSTLQTFQVNNVQVTIFYQFAPTVTQVGVGTFSAVNGYSYVYVYGNSITGHVSSPTFASINTGPFTNIDHLSISLVASTDPQVDQIRLFRTTDGGAGVYFELPNSPFPNVTGSVNDNAADNELSIVIAPSPDANNPPPTGMVNIEFHTGRMWGTQNNLLYYSGGPDTVLGNGNEAWPPLNVFSFPTIINRLVSLPSGLLVFTVDAIYVVRGIDSGSYTVNEWTRGIGVRQYNAVTIDGSNVYLFTSDRQLLTLTANGFDQTGAHIGDLLEQLDPNLVYLAVHHAGISDNNLFISNGSDTIFSYNLLQQGWNPRQLPSSGVNAIQSIEITPGVFKFLLGLPTTGQLVWQRDLATFDDLGTTFAPSVTIGNIQLADPGQLAQMQGISAECTTAGTFTGIAVLPNEISGSFTALTSTVGGQIVPEPPELPLSTSYRSQRFYWDTVTNQLPQILKHLQIKFSWPSESAKNELLGFSIWGTQPTDTREETGQLPQAKGV